METRFTISLPLEIKEALDKLKREEFYDKSQSEMIRQILSLGLAAKKKGA
jgi:Ribbon-helix-helix protein, copG family.